MWVAIAAIAGFLLGLVPMWVLVTLILRRWRGDQMAWAMTQDDLKSLYMAVQNRGDAADVVQEAHRIASSDEFDSVYVRRQQKYRHLGRAA